MASEADLPAGLSSGEMIPAEAFEKLASQASENGGDLDGSGGAVDDDSSGEPEKTPEKETPPAKEEPASDTAAKADDKSKKADESDPVLKAVNDTLAELRKLSTKEELPAKEESVAEATPPKWVTELIEHDDPAIRKAGESALDDFKRAAAAQAEQEARIAKIEEKQAAADSEAELEKLTDEIHPKLVAVAERYAMTDEDVDKLLETVQNGTEAQRDALTLEEWARRAFPDRVPVSKSATTKDPAPNGRPIVKVESGDDKPATVITDGGGASGPTPKASVPPEGEDMESAVSRGVDSLWGRG